MNLKYRILELIGKRPGINDSEIADELGMEIDLVGKIIEPMLGPDKVVRTPFQTPSGMKIHQYRHMETPVGPTGKPKTKPEIAVDYLEANGTANISEMKSAMGITSKTAHPNAYLTAQLKNGIIKFEGGIWSLGKTAEKKPISVMAKNPDAVARRPVSPPHPEIPEPEVPPAVELPPPPVEVRESQEEPEETLLVTVKTSELISPALYQDMDRIIESLLTPEELRGFLKGSIILHTVQAELHEALSYVNRLAELTTKENNNVASTV